MARLKIPKVVCGGILSLKGSLWRLQDTLTRMRWRLLTCRNEGLLLGRRAGGGGREGLLQVLRQARPVPGLRALPEGRLRRPGGGLAVHLDVLDRGPLEGGSLPGAAQVGARHHQVVQSLLRFLSHDDFWNNKWTKRFNVTSLLFFHLLISRTYLFLDIFILYH